MPHRKLGREWVGPPQHTFRSQDIKLVYDSVVKNKSDVVLPEILINLDLSRTEEHTERWLGALQTFYFYSKYHEQLRVSK